MNLWPSWYRPVSGTPGEKTETQARNIAQWHGFTLEYLRGPARDQKAFRARCEIARMLRAKKMSHISIGRFLNREHTTVSHMLRRAG